MLRVENLSKYYSVSEGFLRRSKRQIRAVDNVSFSVRKGETFGIAGESGSGKSTLCLCIARLLQPDRGKLFLDGLEYTTLKGKELRALRSRIQMVFQNPASSLDPHMRVRDIILEPVRSLKKEEDKEGLVIDLLQKVGLPKWVADRFPNELSGGMMQRVAIARAISIKPDVVVLDEPTSALDASIQAQILNLFNSLQKEYGITYIIVSHDLSVIGHMCDEIAVMYAGRIVEVGKFEEIFYNPRHPYTAALLASSHFLGSDEIEQAFILRGEAPSPRRPPSGCTLHPRCPLASEICSQEYPGFVKLSSTHLSACHNIARLGDMLIQSEESTG